jgi:tetratricopeptide (TPR) repeat protein
MHPLTIYLGCCTLAVALAVASCSKPPGQAEFDRGVFELRRNNPVRARALFEKSIARRPGSEENAIAYNYLGVAAWRLGQYRAAQEAFEDSRRLNPTLAEPVYNLAMLHRQAGEYAEAARLLEQAARLDESDPRPLEVLASLYAQNRQWPLARRSLHAALNRAPNSARILTALATIDLHTVGPEKSIESHLIALEKDARYAPALFNVGLIYQTRLGDAERAATYFRRFLALKPSGPAAEYAKKMLQLPTMPVARADSTPPPLRAAPTVEPNPLSAPAATVATSAVALPTPIQPTAPLAPPAPTIAAAPATPTTAQPPRTPDERDDELIRQAAARAERGDGAGALEMLLLAASTAGLENRADGQEKLLRAASRIAFDDARAHLALGEFLLAQRKHADAVRAFKQATVLDAQSFPAHIGLARSATAVGEFDAALVSYQQAVRLDPRNPDALWELAQLLDRQLQLAERAINAYRDFEKLFPADPRVARAGDRIRALTATLRATTTARAAPPPTPAPAPTPVPARPPMPSPPPAAQTPVPAPSTRPAPAPSPSAEPFLAREPTPPARRLNIRPAPTRNPNIAIAAYNQGAELIRQRRWEAAAQSFRRAIEHNPQFENAYYNLGLAYSQLGDYELAKDAYMQTLAIKPDHIQARYNLALLYLQTRDLPSAAALASDVARRDPRFAAAHYLLGQIYAERPETLPLARAAYARFLELEPNHPAAAVVRHWLATN